MSIKDALSFKNWLITDRGLRMIISSSYVWKSLSYSGFYWLTPKPTLSPRLPPATLKSKVIA